MEPGGPFAGFRGAHAIRPALDRQSGTSGGGISKTRLHWKMPRRIFVNSMSDLFHEALSAVAISSECFRRHVASARSTRFNS